MKNKNTRILLSVLAVAALVVLLFLFFNKRNADTFKEPSFTTAEWKDDYSVSNKGPYGLYFMEQLLLEKEKFSTFTVYPSVQFLDSIVALDSALFMFVGSHLALTQQEVNQLLKSVKRGNQCFFSTNQIPDYFFDQLADSVRVTYYLQEEVSVVNQQQKFSLINLYQGDTIPGAWNVINPYRLHGTKTKWKSLFTVNTSVVYYEITYGAGKIYLYLSPQAFFNYQLKRKEGFDHFMAVFEDVKPAHIHWLQFATFENNQYEEVDEGSPEDSLLSKIFEHPALKWAFMVLIIGLILYFILNSRRIRPVLPVNNKQINQGYNYVETIGDIYFSNKKPSQMLHVIRKNFYTIVQNQFYLDLSKGYTEKQLTVLAEKSGLTRNRVEKVLKTIAKKHCASNEELSQIYSTVCAFYYDSGCWSEAEQTLNNKTLITIYRTPGQGMGLIISGIVLLAVSFIALAVAVAWGILLWPIGIGVIFYGSRLLARPIMRFNEEELTFYPLMKAALTFSKKDLTRIERDGEVLTFYFGEGLFTALDLRSVHLKQQGLILALKYQLNKNRNGDTK